MRFVAVVVVVGLGLAAARPCAEITRRKKCKKKSHRCEWDKEKKTCGTSGGDACSGLEKKTCKNTAGCAYKKKTCSTSGGDACVGLEKKTCKNTAGCAYEKKTCSKVTCKKLKDKKSCKKAGCKFDKKKGKCK